MRAELEKILVGRYNPGILSTVMEVLPTDEQVKVYEQHTGLTNLPVDLSGSPALVVVDTSRFKTLNYAWINRRHTTNLRLFLSSGEQTVSQHPRVQNYTQQVIEGLEITFHYGYHDRRVPYRDTLKPLW